MKLGCCAYSKDRSVDPVGLQSIPVMKKLGYDYVELGLSGLAALSEEQFQQVLKVLKDNNLPCEACNNFVPASVRLTGPDADMEKARAYVEKALSRAKQAGVKVVVFGSSGAKNVPEGFDKEKAYQQIVEFCRMVEPYAAAADITIAIEPLNYVESNIINTVAEGYQLAKDVDCPHIKLLLDYFHWVRNKEPLEELDQCASMLVHAHFAEDIGRAYPSEPKEIYNDFMTRLKGVGYDARISMEAGTKGDFEQAAGVAEQLFRKYYL